MYKALLRRKQQKGQGLVEYALIIGLVAVVCIGALNGLADSIQDTFATISAAMP